MKYPSLITLLGFCLTLTACGPDTFYIPIDNKLGSTKPLSKNDDTIRVVVMAKVKTDDTLQEQGYLLEPVLI